MVRAHGREAVVDELKGMEVAVIGLGASGVAAARLAIAKGAEAYVSDSRSDDAVAARGADLGASGAAVELGGHDIGRIAGADLVVASPGIAPDAPVLRSLAQRGVGWISEPDFAARFYTGSLIAVTGTNGKTTTTLLVDHLLRAGGISSAAGGNVGGGLAPTASDLALQADQADWIVLEMSSFQLGGVSSFRPDIGVVTNLSPDHLDRYPSVEAYYADKARLFERADEGSRWVLPVDEPDAIALAGDVPGDHFYFGEGSGSHAFVDEDTITLNVGGDIEPLLPVSELPLLGAHNVRNALTAALVAYLAGAEPGGLTAGLGSARALPHRLEPVADRDQVLWVNDSKATNVAATRSALESLERPVVLLLGGKDKGEDFTGLASVMPGRVRAILAYGEAGPRAARELGGWMAQGSAGEPMRRPGHSDVPPLPHVEMVEGRLEAVVARARASARPGDAILLSPACSSYDMYESYEHRGRHFVALAQEVA